MYDIRIGYLQLSPSECSESETTPLEMFYSNKFYILYFQSMTDFIIYLEYNKEIFIFSIKLRQTLNGTEIRHIKRRFEIMSFYIHHVEVPISIRESEICHGSSLEFSLVVMYSDNERFYILTDYFLDFIAYRTRTLEYFLWYKCDVFSEK